MWQHPYTTDSDAGCFSGACCDGLRQMLQRATSSGFRLRPFHPLPPPDVLISVVELSGEEVLRVHIGPLTTACDILRQVQDTGVQTQLAWAGRVLHRGEKLLTAGVTQGAVLHLIHMNLPCFDLVSDNAEKLSRGTVVQVSDAAQKEWGWCTALLCRDVTEMSVKIGSTGSKKAYVTDYFVGVLPEKCFQAQSRGNVLGDEGVGLILSSHSLWSGSVKVQGLSAGRPWGNRTFSPGDVLTVEMASEGDSVRFACDEAWSQYMKVQLSHPVRLGVSLYCETEAGQALRHVECCRRPPGLSP